MASDQALLNTLGQAQGDVLLELSEVAAVNLLGESQGGVDDIRIQVDNEVLGDRAGTGVLGVQAGDRNRRLAVQVLLEVNATLGKDCALKLGQGGVEFRGQSVLQHETAEDVAVGDNGEELGSARVDVRRVQAAGLEEDARSGDTEAGQDREVGAVCEIDLAAHAGGDTGVGGRVEVEFQADIARGDFRLKLSEAVDGTVGSKKLSDNAEVWGWVGGSGWIAQQAGSVAGTVGAVLAAVGWAHRRSIGGGGESSD